MGGICLMGLVSATPGGSREQQNREPVLGRVALPLGS